MKLIFSSFGIGNKRTTQLSPTFFDRMPPAVFSAKRQQFQPDFSALLLAEKIVIDGETLSSLERHDRVVFSDYGQVLRRLDREGFLQIEDYSGILAAKGEQLDRALKEDLTHSESYRDIAAESISAWQETFYTFKKGLPEELVNNPSVEVRARLNEVSHWRHVHANSLAKHVSLRRACELTAKDRVRDNHMHIVNPYDAELFEELLSPYLEYTNANIMLSEQLGAGVFDWSDIMPFYRSKFDRIDEDHAKDSTKPDILKQLFTITFPEIDEWPIDTVLKMLTDKRITNLRETIASVVEKGEEIDSDYVVRMLRDVISIEQSIASTSKIISYVTTPLGFIPFFGAAVQKGAEEIGSAITRKKKTKHHSWFFMASGHSKSLSGD